MTLQISSADTISGIPIKKVRGFFRHLVTWHEHFFELPRMQEQLSLDTESALALATELQTQGYVNPPERGVYTFTDKGEDLVRASAAGKVRRQTAEKALIGLLARVEQYNSDPNRLLTVEGVVVFGSFLSANDELGDLDIASNIATAILMTATQPLLRSLMRSALVVISATLWSGYLGQKPSCVNY
jgi:hypothetical protein